MDEDSAVDDSAEEDGEKSVGGEVVAVVPARRAHGEHEKSTLVHKKLRRELVPVSSDEEEEEERRKKRATLRARHATEMAAAEHMAESLTEEKRWTPYQLAGRLERGGAPLRMPGGVDFVAPITSPRWRLQKLVIDLGDLPRGEFGVPFDSLSDTLVERATDVQTLRVALEAIRRFQFEVVELHPTYDTEYTPVQWGALYRTLDRLATHHGQALGRTVRGALDIDACAPWGIMDVAYIVGVAYRLGLSVDLWYLWQNARIDAHPSTRVETKLDVEAAVPFMAPRTSCLSLALVEILALRDVLHHFCVDEFVFPAQLHPGDRCELLAFALQQLRGTNGDMRFKVFDMRNGTTLSAAIRRALRHASIGPYEMEIVEHVNFY